MSQLTPRFLRVDKKQKKRATGLEHFFLRGQPPLSSPVWDIYIGIFSPTPTFITVYVRYRFCREGEKKKSTSAQKRATMMTLRTDFRHYHLILKIERAPCPSFFPNLIKHSTVERYGFKNHEEIT